MTQSIMTANNVSYATVLDFIKMMNIVAGEKRIPESIYLLKKVCSEKASYKKHWFCKNCEMSFGTNRPERDVCNECQKSSADYFISVSVTPYLKKIVQHNFDSILAHHAQQNAMNGDVINDINSAMWHRNLENRENILTVNINTDGVAPYSSSIRSSLWPILITINDLPLNERLKKKNVIAGGYWLSEKQPNMNLFLQPFIEEMNQLAVQGIRIGNRNFLVKVCCVCVDSPARSKLLRMKQFNGYKGCTFCLHPGQHYPYIPSPRRILRSFLNDVDEWEQLSDADKRRGDAINGVKGRTELLDLNGFDPMKQVPVDFMHCALLGVVKLMLTLWFSSESSDKPYYVPPWRKNIAEDRYRQMKTYTECKRKNTSLIKKFKVFKANEFFNFLF
jgi:hypothetical protein